MKNVFGGLAMAQRRALNFIFIGLTIGASYSIGAASQMDRRYRIDRDNDRAYLIDSQRDERLLLDENKPITRLAYCEEQERPSGIEYEVEGIVDRLRNLYGDLVE